MTGLSRARPADGASDGAKRWGIVVVEGESMRPVLRPGDRLLARHGRRPRPGDVVLARFADGRLVVKRVAERRGAGWWLLSDNQAEGIDSRHRGAVPDDAVLAVARLRLWPRPGRLRTPAG